MNNYKKGKMLKALNEGSFCEEQLSPPTFACKLNDLRFFIENVDPRINEDNLLDYFEVFGEVIDVGIDQTDRKAFITFLYFCDKRPGKNHNIQDIPITLESVYKTPDILRTSTIMVTGDIESISGDNFRKLFTNVGVFVDFRRTVNRKTKKPSQFVFIKFKDHFSINSCVYLRHKIGNISLEIFAYDEIF